MEKCRKSGVAAFIGLSVALLFGITACTKKGEDAVQSKRGEIALVCKEKTIEVSSGNGVTVDKGTATINKPGTYRISGTLADGQIIVNSEAKGDVNLILDGADITCSDSSPIYVMQASHTIIELEVGTENVLTDGSDYVVNSEDEPAACIFSKDDLTVKGDGSLSVTGNYRGGIHGKDNVVLCADNITVEAKEDGITGKDGLTVTGGKLTINAGEKGIVSSGMLAADDVTCHVTAGNDTIHSNGEVVVNSGTYTLSSGDDGIHADNSLTITGGNIAITKCEEGLEAAQITITDGDIDLVADDDGINATSSSDDEDSDNVFEADEDCSICITGGNIHVNAGGDGMDSNGSIDITGGMITVSGSSLGDNGALDYNGELTVTGGTLIAAGRRNMAQSVSDSSSQYAIAMVFTAAQKSGAVISLQGEEKNEIISFTAEKDIDHIVFSTPDLKEGGTYTICVDGEEIVSHTLSQVSTWLNEDGETQATMGHGFGGHGGPGGGMPDKKRDFGEPDAKIPEGDRDDDIRDRGVPGKDKENMTPPEGKDAEMPQGDKPDKEFRY